MHVRLLLKRQCALPGICSQCNQFTSPAPTGKQAGIRSEAGSGSPGSPLFVPITMATLCKPRSAAAALHRLFFLLLAPT